jgi:hypothetical protein
MSVLSGAAVDPAAAGPDDGGCGLAREATMSEILTFDEIKARYAPDWVLIGEPQFDEHLNVLAGRVLYHGPDGDEVCLKAREYPRGRYALKFCLYRRICGWKERSSARFSLEFRRDSISKEAGVRRTRN